MTDLQIIRKCTQRAKRGEEEARLADVREPCEDEHLVSASREKTEKNETLPFSAKWLGLENVMLSEISQIRTNTE